MTKKLRYNGFWKELVELKFDPKYDKQVSEILDKEGYNTDSRYNQRTSDCVTYYLWVYKIDLDLAFLNEKFATEGLTVSVKHIEPFEEPYEDDDDDLAYMSTFPEEFNERGIPLSHFDDEDDSKPVTKAKDSLGKTVFDLAKKLFDSSDERLRALTISPIPNNPHKNVFLNGPLLHMEAMFEYIAAEFGELRKFYEKSAV